MPIVITINKAPLPHKKTGARQGVARESCAMSFPLPDIVSPQHLMGAWCGGLNATCKSDTSKENIQTRGAACKQAAPL